MVLEEHFSFMLNNGRRTYFFDIKESSSGGLYLKISESKKTDHGFERYRIMIFSEDLDQFADMFQKASRKLSELKGAMSVSNKSANNPLNHNSEKSYMPWTAEDDDKLEVLFCEGLSLSELADIFKRNPGESEQESESYN